MSTPFDLSDALKTPPPTLSPRPGGKKRGGGRGTGTRLDDFARPVLWGALVVSILLLIYVGWGLFGGAWSNPVWDKLGGGQRHQYHTVQLANIGFVFSLLRISALVLVVSLLICCLREEGAGYVLLGAGAVLYFVLPLLTDQVFGWQGARATEASQDVLREMQTVALLLGVPGLIWSGVDIVRRFRMAAEGAAVRRANLKYATAAKYRALGGKQTSHVTAEQRQYRTYQFLAVTLVVVEPLLIFLNLDTVKVWMGHLLGAVDAVTNRFSLSANPSGIPQLQGDGDAIVFWSVLIALNLILLAQVLRLLEYFCFRRKL